MKALVKIFFFLLLSSTMLLSQQSLSSEFFDIVITKSAANLWDCKGSGAYRDVSFWKPTPPAGFFTFGHMASKTFHPTDKQQPVTIALKPKRGFEDLLKAPTSYQEVWKDYGSNGYRHVRIFRLVCPAGYKALGMVASANDAPKPDDNNCRCIKEMVTQNGTTTRLVSRAMYGSDDPEGRVAFWDDRNSGAYADVALWKPIIYSKPGEGVVSLPPNTFFATLGYESKPIETPYALNLKFDVTLDEDIEMPERPILKRAGVPLPAELKAMAKRNEYSLPFFAVYDEEYPSQIEQFLASPTYKVIRTTYYKAKDRGILANEDGEGVDKSYSITTGMSKETNYNSSLGITFGLSVTATASASGLVASAEVSVTASMETSYTYAWGGSTTNSREETFSYQMKVPAGKFGVLFTEVNEYQVLRADNSVVNNSSFTIDGSYIELIFDPKKTVTPTPPVTTPVVNPTASVYGVESSRITCSGKIYILNKVNEIYAQNGTSWQKIGGGAKSLLCENNQLIAVLTNNKKVMYDGKPNIWITPPTPRVTPNLNGKTFQFVIFDPNGKGKCLDADGNTIGANGTKMQLWQPTGGVTQKWKTTLNSNGTYTFVTADPNGKGKCLDANGPTIAFNGGKIQLWQPTGGGTQQWKVILNANDTYTLVIADPKGNGKCLDADGTTIANNGTKIQLWPPTGGVTQQWKLVEVK